MKEHQFDHKQLRLILMLFLIRSGFDTLLHKNKKPSADFLQSDRKERADNFQHADPFQSKLNRKQMRGELPE